MALEAANLMAFKAAWLYDAGKPCGAEANAAKYLAGEACFDACQQAVMTLGGFGYAKEYHVERYLRESLRRPHRAGEPAADPVLHRRESARPAEVVLNDKTGAPYVYGRSRRVAHVFALDLNAAYLSGHDACHWNPHVRL